MASPILTLTTDFGLSDHYVGVMKGVILNICPRARIVDISHDITPFEIAEGAYTVAQAYRYFPRKTLHVVVVDPGVGTARRPILMEAAGQYFVAPDNGVLALVFAREKHRIRLISNEELFRKPVSATFHGRDIFAPVAAHVAAGVAPSRVGKLITDYVRPSFETPLRTGPHTWTGRILHIDRFGNIVTNFHAEDFAGLEHTTFALALGPREINVLARNYAEGGPGEPFLIVGSSGYLEISVGRGSAAALTGCQTGAPVELRIEGRPE
jgi:S-adenosyl-L-methionine hydrolase (adenosine-forming)